MNDVASSVDEPTPVKRQQIRMAAPPVDLDHPSNARICDYLLDGSVHWGIDRALGRLIDAQIPEFRSIVLAHRQFVGRAVKYLAKSGVRQFVDIGSGLLSKDNTHQLADLVAPDSRVVYVDNDPVAVAHVELLLDEAGDPDRHAIIDGDLCEPIELWDDVLATGLIDLAEPVAILLFSVLHLVKPGLPGDDHAARVVACYRKLLPPGSYLGISHLTGDGVPSVLERKLRELNLLWGVRCGGKGYTRSHSAIAAMFDGLEILDPGLVWTPQWHPEVGPDPLYADSPSEAAVLAGIGRKLAVPPARR
jgi:hypothetical protein